MRFFWALLSAAFTIFLIIILNSKMLLPAPLGSILAPQQGFWQNAESMNEDFGGMIHSNYLKGKTTVYFDERLVPHVFAEQEQDAYFVQGFLHAKFRLWQMQLQTMAAAGRVSEIIGEKGLNHDREFRRLGMVAGAENSLRELENDADTKMVCDAYTAGVNAYIDQLTPATLPLEYKLTGTTPEKWSNLKVALFLKYMAYDLAGRANDLEMTNAKNYFSKEDFDLLFPAAQDSLDPIIPVGTKFPAAGIVPNAPKGFDSLDLKINKDVVENEQPIEGNGSNNWAVSGKKTASGYPILANDPHLALNLPSLWYEIQISTPAFNSYGASFPGAPNVIIGFNDSIAFGFTNGGRDVRDYYQIKFKDKSRKEYWFNNEWKKTEFKIEHIGIAGKPSFEDTVAYTVFGPVIYEPGFLSTETDTTAYYAVRWKGQDKSNELRLFYEMNRAKNYSDYSQAANFLRTPGQNIVFAAKNGDIALRTQGEFPAKWKGQGDFIMPGTDSSYMWQGMIPDNEIPFQYNPERGFVSSANQRPVQADYPYYLGRDYPVPRGKYLNRYLNKKDSITVKDMEDLQNSTYNIFAEALVPLFVRHLQNQHFSGNQQKYFDLLKTWQFTDDRNLENPTVFSILWKNFSKDVFSDEYKNAPKNVMNPMNSTLMEAILRDSTYKFIDDISTPQKESLSDIMSKSFADASKELDSISATGNLAWGKYKQTRIYHLTKLEPFSSDVLDVNGSKLTLDANSMNIEGKQAHGPSWRMIVHLAPETEAFGIYPGGQSGNPGSRFYKNFIGDWVEGKYYKLWVMKPEEKNDKRIISTLQFSN